MIPRQRRDVGIRLSMLEFGARRKSHRDVGGYGRLAAPTRSPGDPPGSPAGVAPLGVACRGARSAGKRPGSQWPGGTMRPSMRRDIVVPPLVCQEWVLLVT